MTHPEHSDEGYKAAIAMGAGFIECDVASSKDLVPVCRHSQCDLHTTTNVLFNPALAAKCSMPFTPAVLNSTSGAVITPAGALCCTFDFTAAEYSSLCAIQDIGSGWSAAQTVQEYLPAAPFFRSTVYDTYSIAGTCAAHPATLAGMAAYVVAAGRDLVPEQKVCDTLCQYKLALANPSANATWKCTPGVYCQALVNAWTDTIVTVLNGATNSNNLVASPRAPLAGASSGWALQSFELNTALYTAATYPQGVSAFLYQLSGGSTSGNVAHPFLGFYPQTWTTGAQAWNLAGVPLSLGAYGKYAVNGSSLGGWADVFTAIAGGVQAGGISIADLVVPQGALMVASANAKKAAAQGMVFMPWTLERSAAVFGTVAANNYLLGGAQVAGGSTRNVAFSSQAQYPASQGGYYAGHAGVSSLDYEDMLFMLYALKYDVPNVVGVFSDYPATTTAFANCVPQMDAVMPVSATKSWATPPVDINGVSTAGVTCGNWIANSGYYSILAGPSTCVLAPTANFAGCCAAVNNLFGALSGSPTANCMCEADFAGFMLGALGVGNSGPGMGPIGLPFPFVMNKCNSMGYTSLYWPNATNPAFDCALPLGSGGASALVIPPNPTPGSTRTPYLMAVTSTSVTLRWRTAAPAPTVVSYGAAIGTLSQTFSGDAAGVIEHTAVLTGLTAGTMYYYAAGAAAAPAGGAAGAYFKTAPAPGSATNVRIWAIGDFGEVRVGGRVWRCSAPHACLLTRALCFCRACADDARPAGGGRPGQGPPAEHLQRVRRVRGQLRPQRRHLDGARRQRLQHWVRPALPVQPLQHLRPADAAHVYLPRHRQPRRLQLDVHACGSLRLPDGVRQRAGRDGG
jgi:hypothetical protein